MNIPSASTKLLMTPSGGTTLEKFTGGLGVSTVLTGDKYGGLIVDGCSVL